MEIWILLWIAAGLSATLADFAVAGNQGWKFPWPTYKAILLILMMIVLGTLCGPFMWLVGIAAWRRR